MATTNGILANFITIPETARMAYLESLVNNDLAFQKAVGEYRDYYAGDHEVALTERQKEFLGKAAAGKFRLNQCPVVVESLAERLALSGFEEVKAAGEASAGSEPETEPATTTAGLPDFASKLLEDSRMDAGQEELYRQAAIDQRTYIVLDIDPETGLITLNHNDLYTCTKADGDEEGVKLHFATNKRRGKPIFATKRWAVTQGDGAGFRRYWVVYYPDRIERFYQDDRERGGGELGQMGWRKLVEKTGPLAGLWPQPWVDATGQPLGIPVVEFGNGRASELHEVVPLQRALNKSVIDLIAAADQAGFGVLFASGWAPTSDGRAIVLDSGGQISSGNKPLAYEPGAIFYTTNEQGTLTRVPGDDLDKLIQVVDRHILSIAQVSRTPITNFQLFGQIPGADTQKQLDQGLVAKAESRQRGYGNAWEDVVYLARRMATGAPVYEAGRVVGYGLKEYADFRLETPTRLSALWKDAQVRNEKEHLETLSLKKALGVPAHQLFLEMGYEDSQADKFAAEVEAQRLAALALALPAVDPGNSGDGGTDTTPVAGKGKAAENAPANLDSVKGLNGAQITAALEVIAGISAGTIQPEVATELLVALGIDPARVAVIVNSTEVAPTPQSAPAAGKGAPPNG